MTQSYVSVVKQTKRLFQQVQKSVKEFDETSASLGKTVTSSGHLRNRLRILLEEGDDCLGALGSIKNIRQKLIHKHVDELSAILQVLQNGRYGMSANLPLRLICCAEPDTLWPTRLTAWRQASTMLTNF